MKKRKAILIPLLAIGGILTTIVLAAALAALVMVLETNFYTDGSTLPEAQDGLALDNWMEAIEDNTLLTDVAIPGAHDAGCINMMWAYQTQNKTIAEQLQMGVRYFDIRIANDNGNARIFHADLMGVGAESVIDAMRKWLSEHPSECLIVDFQHFKATDDSEEASKRIAYELARNYLSEFAVANNSGADDLTFVKGLRMADVRGKCLIIWGRDDEYAQNDWIFLRDNDEGTRKGGVLHSYYVTEYNTQPSKTYIAEYLPRYWQMYEESEGGLFVLQGQLTDGLYVFGPANVEISHDDNMNAYLATLPADKVAEANIVMRDYVTPSKCILTIKLNLGKATVKARYAEIVKGW